MSNEGGENPVVVRILLPVGEPIHLAFPPLSLASLVSFIAAQTETQAQSIRLTYRDAQNQRLMLNGESRYQEALKTLHGSVLQVTVVLVPDKNNTSQELGKKTTDLEETKTPATNRVVSGEFSPEIALEPEKELQRRVVAMLGNSQHYFSAKFKALLFTLSSAPSITTHELELSDAQLGAYECVLLSEIVELLPELRLLHLQGNSIGNSGVTQLCDSLVRHKSVRYLDLRGNQISGKGLKALAMMIRKLPDLEILAIANNKLTRSDIDSLRDAAPPRCRVYHDSSWSCSLM